MMKNIMQKHKKIYCLLKRLERLYRGCEIIYFTSNGFSRENWVNLIELRIFEMSMEVNTHPFPIIHHFLLSHNPKALSRHDVRSSIRAQIYLPWGRCEPWDFFSLTHVITLTHLNYCQHSRLFRFPSVYYDFHKNQ